MDSGRRLPPDELSGRLLSDECLVSFEECAVRLRERRRDLSLSVPWLLSASLLREKAPWMNKERPLSLLDWLLLWSMLLSADVLGRGGSSIRSFLTSSALIPGSSERILSRI